MIIKVNNRKKIKQRKERNKIEKKYPIKQKEK